MKRHNKPTPLSVDKKHIPASPLISPLSLGILVALSIIGRPAHSETTIPSSSSTTELQVLAPGESAFTLPNGSLIQASVGDGISGDASQNWTLNVLGSVSAAGNGISLSSLSAGGATVTNGGTISGAGGAGISLLNGGTIVNQAGGVITGGTGILFSSGAYSLNNAGRVEATGVGL